MDNKLIYWIPVVGLFITLLNYDKDNGMGAFWSYYQALMIVALISTVSFIVF